MQPQPTQLVAQRVYTRRAAPPVGEPIVRDKLHLQRFFGRDRDPGGSDLALFLGIVLESARLARAKYPGSTFQMILWDGRDDARIGIIEHRLTAAGIPVHRLTAAIPDFATAASRYILSPHDGHPNALMHERLAEYILDRMMVRSAP